jgi:hypothetical protein
MGELILQQRNIQDLFKVIEKLLSCHIIASNLSKTEISEFKISFAIDIIPFNPIHQWNLIDLMM